MNGPDLSAGGLAKNGSARPAIVVIGALAASVAAAAVVVALFGPPRSSIARLGPVATSTRALPALEPLAEVEPIAEVAPSPGLRPTPAEVLRTSTVVAASWAPGLALVKTTMKPGWEERRAEIEDRTQGDVRSYAIGDLLPHGSLLVGISTGTADIMVGDAHLVRLFADGRVAPLEDFALAAEPPALSHAKGLDEDYRDRVLLAVHDARSQDPSVVQAAIDELVASGDPAVELLIPYVDSALPVRAEAYRFPSGGELDLRPRVLGELVMLVLERITGQTFGHVKEGMSEEERAAIARAWRRWWGGGAGGDE
jgi:hypothetical protein